MESDEVFFFLVWRWGLSVFSRYSGVLWMGLGVFGFVFLRRKGVVVFCCVCARCGFSVFRFGVTVFVCSLEFLFRVVFG